MMDKEPTRRPTPDWWTAANAVTVLRAFLTIPIAYALLQLDPFWDNIAAGLFLIATASDGLDGYLARVRNEQSEIGALLDPVADKILGIIVLGLLVWTDRLPSWMLWTLLTKEMALLLGGFFLLRAGRKVTEARQLGKWATVILFFGFIDVIGGYIGIGLILCTIGIVLSLGAGVDYLVVTMRSN